MNTPRTRPGIALALLLAAIATFRFLGGSGAAAPDAPGPPIFRPDLNRCPAHRLLLIKGIGPKRAQAIVEERRRGGDFTGFDEVDRRVLGIGPALARRLEAEGALPVPNDSIQRFE